MVLQNAKGKGKTIVLPLSFCVLPCYLVSAVSAPAFLRLSQLYLRWNFSTRPVVSRNFILPVKKGWQAEQISTVMFFFVLRVTNLLPQPQVTVVSAYSGWMPSFMGTSKVRTVSCSLSAHHSRAAIGHAA